MKTYKANEVDSAALATAARNLKAANAAIAAASKTVEASKAFIADWLKVNRDCTLDTLDIGEIVQIEGVILIERAKQNKFDEKAFSLANPVLHAQFKRDFPMNKFKALV